MSSLKKTKSLGSSNKGRFHHNKPRICNLLNRENSERLDQTEGKSKAAHTAQVTVSLQAGPPHLFPANLEASWGAAEPAPHLVLPREIPPRPPPASCLERKKMLSSEEETVRVCVCWGKPSAAAFPSDLSTQHCRELLKNLCINVLQVGAL